MRFVRVGFERDPWPANVLDPEPYLRVLPELAAQLPTGAAAFATDADHYDFGSVRCVKDLTVGAMTVREAGHGQVAVVIEFEPNRFKHDSGLVIRYEGVTRFTVEVDESKPGREVWPESRRIGDVQLDEILPARTGCTHEVKLTGGTIFVQCADLHATWGSPGT